MLEMIRLFLLDGIGVLGHSFFYFFTTGSITLLAAPCW